MAIPANNIDEKYTYQDYINWPPDERWELIEGRAYNMSAAPNTNHQIITGELFGHFWSFLKDKSCRVFSAPFDVRLADFTNQPDIDIPTVVQPDISIICDPEKLDEKGCKGSPDLVVEVISPSTVRKDIRDKYYLYEKHGVKEYWIVYPFETIIERFILGENGKFDPPRKYGVDMEIECSLFPGFKLPVSDFF